MQKLLALGAGIAATALLALGAPLSASAATYTVVGNDVSWPQCGTTPPATAAFGVVGVNDGLANTTNPCLADQLAWAKGLAGGSTQPTAQLYVNTANPGKQGKWWPTSTKTQAGTAVTIPKAYGTCTGKVNAGCAYVYGWSMAEQDATTRLKDDPGRYVWWLDVETSNTWSRDTTANRADLEAMVDYFSGLKDPVTGAPATVGVYSTSYQFGKIVGTLPTTGSSLVGLRSWIAGASGQADARDRCLGASFTRGQNALVQWVQGGLDYDLSCTD